MNQTIRVLIVYHHLPHYRYDLFRRLEEDPGLEVEFAAASESSDGSIVTIPGHLLKAFHPLRNVWLGPLLWQVGLTKIIFSRRPDVIIFLGDCKHISTWTGSILARTFKASILYWTIGWFRPEKGLHRLYKLAFYRLADKLLIYGNYGRVLGARMGYPAKRMITVYNSSSDPMVSDEASAEGSHHFAQRLPPLGGLIVTAVIRLNALKKLDLLIRAAAILRASGRLVEVLLVGKGPQREQLKDLAEKLGVPLWMPGPAYSDQELTDTYTRSLVSVVPSSAGLTVLQSFKYGVPVITHNYMSEQVPECEAITPGLTGDLYEYGDVNDLARTIDKWISIQLARRVETARQCKASLLAHWNADTQAQIIGNEVRNTKAALRLRSPAHPSSD